MTTWIRSLVVAVIAGCLLFLATLPSSTSVRLWLVLAIIIVCVVLFFVLPKEKPSKTDEEHNQAIREAMERQASVAEAKDHREREPKITVILSDPVVLGFTLVIYRVRNDGPQDLDEVIVHRPITTDQIIYPVSLTGGAYGGGSPWADEINFGPVKINEEKRFTLCLTPKPDLPEFRPRIECRLGSETWELYPLLPSPYGESI